MIIVRRKNKADASSLRCQYDIYISGRFDSLAMKGNYFTTAGASAYHPARLIIKLAPAGAAPLAAFHDMTRAPAAPAALTTRGLSALAALKKPG
jgi:hypothetical protein